MAARGRDKGKNAPVIIKRVAPPSGDGHHGGAWKIAYADFVTAMMAFFLLMWLVNATTEAQRRGIADYFAPTNPLARGASGSGQPFGGRSLHSDGAMVSNAPLSPMMRAGQPGPESDLDEDEEGGPPRRPQPSPDGADASPRPDSPNPAAPGADGPARREAGQAAAEAARQAAEATRQATIARAAEEIREAVRMDPALAALARQLLVEEVAEGLRVQLVDAEGQPVFQNGQAAPNERGRALLARVAAVIARLPHPIEITGHTDAAPFRGGADRSNWDLSSERANATRRLLADAGIPESRIRSVSGRADRDPLLPAQPLAPANRRVAVLMVLPAATPAPR